ncbi:hypothetical protein KSC_101200 [Ktedonobacter sp. SOSP1-52]|nr:hypothetical protein KSC_101200 [Ktedonobacter sp. SOSP1-52]
MVQFHCQVDNTLSFPLLTSTGKVILLKAEAQVDANSLSIVVEPSVCVVTQGSKEFLLGQIHYHDDPFYYLQRTVHLRLF